MSVLAERIARTLLHGDVPMSWNQAHKLAERVEAMLRDYDARDLLPSEAEVLVSLTLPWGNGDERSGE